MARSDVSEMRKGCREQPWPRKDVKISVLARQQECKGPRLRGDDVLRSHFRTAEMTDSRIFEATEIQVASKEWFFRDDKEVPRTGPECICKYMTVRARNRRGHRGKSASLRWLGSLVKDRGWLSIDSLNFLRRRSSETGLPG